MNLIDKDTVVMLHGRHFIDNSYNTFTLVNNVTTIDEIAKFDKCYKFENNATLKLPNSIFSKFREGDFTLEFWLNQTNFNNSYPSPIFLGTGYTTSRGIWCHSRTSEFQIGIAFEDNTSTTFTLNPNPIQLGQWHHIALVRSINEYILFIDGIEKGRQTHSKNVKDAQGDVFIGGTASTSECCNCRIEEFRISKKAIWTSNFTPPTAKYVYKTLDEDDMIPDMVGLDGALVNNLEAIRGDLKANLAKKRVDVLDTDTVTTLVDKVAKIKGSPIGWDLEETGEVFQDNTINENDAIVLQKYGNLESKIDLIPTPPFDIGGGINTCEYTFDNSTLAVGSEYADVKIYSIMGDEYTLTQSFTLPGSAQVSDIKFSKDGSYMVVTASYMTQASVYKKNSSGSYALLQNLSTASELHSCAISSSGSFIILGGTGSRLDAYFLGDAGKYVKGAIESPGGGVTSMSMTSDDRYILMCYSLSKYGIALYEKLDGNTFTKVPISTTLLPSGRISSAVFSKDNQLVSILNSSSPYGNMYTFNNGTLTKLPNSTISVPDRYGTCDFSYDSKYYAVKETNVGQTIRVYKRGEDNVFTKLPTPKENQTGGGVTSIKFSPNREHIITTSDRSGATPPVYAAVYRTETKNIVTNFNVPNLPYLNLENKLIGYAQETKNKGEQIKVNLFPKLNIL